MYVASCTLGDLHFYIVILWLFAAKGVVFHHVYLYTCAYMHMYIITGEIETTSYSIPGIPFLDYSRICIHIIVACKK